HQRREVLQAPEDNAPTEHAMRVGEGGLEGRAPAAHGPVQHGPAEEQGDGEESGHGESDEHGGRGEGLGLPRAAPPESPRPPTPPADIVCMSMTSGYTRDTPASAPAPSHPTNTASMVVTTAWSTMTRTLGAASRRR